MLKIQKFAYPENETDFDKAVEASHQNSGAFVNSVEIAGGLFCRDFRQCILGISDSWNLVDSLQTLSVNNIQFNPSLKANISITNKVYGGIDPKSDFLKHGSSAGMVIVGFIKNVGYQSCELTQAWKETLTQSNPSAIAVVTDTVMCSSINEECVPNDYIQLPAAENRSSYNDITVSKCFLRRDLVS